MSELTLSPDELYEITHARWARKQQEFMTAIGVSSHIRADNTLHVRRVDYLRTAPEKEQNDAPPEQQWAVNVIALRGK